MRWFCWVMLPRLFLILWNSLSNKINAARQHVYLYCVWKCHLPWVHDKLQANYRLATKLFLCTPLATGNSLLPMREDLEFQMMGDAKPICSKLKGSDDTSTDDTVSHLSVFYQSVTNRLGFFSTIEYSSLIWNVSNVNPFMAPQGVGCLFVFNTWFPIPCIGQELIMIFILQKGPHLDLTAIGGSVDDILRD